MTIKVIYIARHGYRSNWLPHGPYPLPPTGVDSDVPLADHGVNQAKELGHYILSIDNQPELIFSSPFYRCIQTSEPIAKLLELPVYLEKGVGEWYKPDRPTIPIPADLETLKKLFPGHDDRSILSESSEWVPGSGIIPSDQGETADELYERCKKFWPIFIKRVEEQFNQVETILIVTHAASKIALGMSLMGYSRYDDELEEGGYIRSGSCSLDKYELIKDYQVGMVDDEGDDDEGDESLENGEDRIVPFEKRRWRMTMNGNTEFLKKGEEMNWSFQSAVEAGSDADIKQRQGNLNKKTGMSVGMEMEELYISLDIPSNNYREKTVVNQRDSLQISGLSNREGLPLFKIGNELYEGQWKKLVGTELVFPQNASLHRKVIEKEDGDDVNEEVDEDLVDKILREKQEAEGEGEGEGEGQDASGNEELKQKVYHVTDRIVLYNVRPM
ncbi:hypothetical protein TBLA_0B01320 [Henningerozyma blattae CBS 6284]|uniref:Transcription factor TFIIIC triple barrel domain-containing protein n=1 Tax=Henningerozyma blattae (strain ATCC 34711 / CBS 6284 / DSM 70876 / NBRC 10599 / NRRL Y-10934 / UCD 77-7) TaxID=1071380 RepID=I2GXX3_HENB6|nr:hypothetical protein TBLA_0B01320 [Tetrapisispora blattae CBS 6284]CCH58975.1 hypothetical protein TBLA_0B01320 [Tetrapisispora blattae CBS 6284]